MKTPVTSLLTPDPEAGLQLASGLAAEITRCCADRARSLPHPGGTHYAQPPALPEEAVAAILFHAICIANQGWRSG